ncbi:MAG: nucleotidyltransferase domain-containing protein [Deltaproteobacteria bacterium]|nr:nucleotidyltransferase domain-containing protein [Deltaproteobacteria bacterium]
MAEKNDDINLKVNQFIEKIKKKYRISRVYIYGSFAKGTNHKWSDIDLAIISPDFSDDTLSDRLVLMKLGASIDDRIEPYPFSTSRFNETDPLVNEICENGIQIV